MDATRPDPDQLLARVAEQNKKESRGRLKVFFGAAPGVGKTYAMLEAAQARRRSGIDVAVGVVETHGRRETEALLEGLEVLPRREVHYKNARLLEFDLDLALQRKPQLLLVDELAHTNAPGSRHNKRWQDVDELLQAGIDVYTAINVLHLDSQNDVIAQITGILVRETVPDSVLDQADEIELVDLPAEELIQRLEQGKVYVPEQAGRARQNFFRPGNLIALRELALRRTADRVDAQMRDYRRDHSIQAAWPVAERILLCIGPSPYSAKLIRATRRMAARQSAEWIVAYVQTPHHVRLPQDVRDRILSALRLAEQLGAETVTLDGTRVGEAVLRYARQRNVSRIVVGKTHLPGWRRWMNRPLADELMTESGEIEICAITGEPGAPLPSRQFEPILKPVWGEAASASAIVVCCTLVALLLRPFFVPANLVAIYLLGVVAISARSTRRIAGMASFLSIAFFDFFCVPPYYTFAIADSEYLVTFIGMLVVALVISTMTIRMRQQAVMSSEREARTHALFQLSRQLSGAGGTFDAARIAATLAERVFQAEVVIFVADEEGKLNFRRRTSDRLPVPSSEEPIAQWVFDHRQPAGKGMDTLPGASALYLPLRGAERSLGVLAALPSAESTLTSPEQMHLLEIFTSQTALAMERSLNSAAARDAELRVEKEQLRSSLLSTVSHDLRTPLASITGSATALLEQQDRLEPSTQRDLLASIASEAERLERLVDNLLEMTRLESGVVIRKDWTLLEEVLGAALHRMERRLARRPVRIDLPADLPLILADASLLEHLFLNLLENAVKHTPEGVAIEVSARRDRDFLVAEVRDEGKGFDVEDESRIFEKFFRGRDAGSDGAGLGLAICKAIAVAHGGQIEAANRPSGGALIRVRLPIGETPPPPPLEGVELG